jgi:hypothetical protein
MAYATDWQSENIVPLVTAFIIQVGMRHLSSSGSS